MNQALIIWNTNLIKGYSVHYITHYYKGKINVFSRETQKTLGYDAFKTIIMVHCESDLLENQVKKDLFMPAFFFHWIASEHFSRVKFSAIDNTVDFASLFVGAGEIKIAIKAKKYLAAGLALVGVTKTSFDLTSSLTSSFLSQNDKDKISKYPGGDFFISKWENISPFLELNLFASNIAATGIIEGFESFTSSWEVIKLNSDLRKELGENKFQLINKFSDNLSALIIEAKQ